jgi:hypothetical protein
VDNLVDNAWTKAIGMPAPSRRPRHIHAEIPSHGLALHNVCNRIAQRVINERQIAPRRARAKAAHFTASAMQEAGAIAWRQEFGGRSRAK